MKRIIVSLILLLLLAGCGAREAAPVAETPAPTPVPIVTAAPTAEPTPTPEPVEITPEPTAEPTPTPSPTPAPPIHSGEYRYESAEYGTWTIILKDSGIFSVIAPDRIYNGEGWSDNGNGTVSLGGTEAAGAAPFFDEFGSSVWRVEGERCEPCM